jgi:hypothetical protein
MRLRVQVAVLQGSPAGVTDGVTKFEHVDVAADIICTACCCFQPDWHLAPQPAHLLVFQATTSAALP